MINSNSSAIGVIFPNSYDALLPELTRDRMMASVPFASRYRLIDFTLSSMTNSGIDNIAILVNRTYHSLMDHLGAGREWDLVRKSGGLHIFPPFVSGDNKPYTGRVDALAGVMDFFRSQKEEYVIITDSNIAANVDYSALIAAHQATGADVTVAYTQSELPASAISSTDNSKGFYYTLSIADGRVNDIFVNVRTPGVHNFSMNIYVLKRELFIDLINTAYVRGNEYFERDVLLHNVDTLNIQAYKYEGYTARISDLNSYFTETMKLLDDANVDALFGPAPVYTKIRDDNPTRYTAGSKAVNIMAADGCVIEGDVENSVLFRGVKIAKGAKVKNCILLQDTVVGEGAEIEYLVTDKNVTVSAGTKVSGSQSFPVYVAKGKEI